MNKIQYERNRKCAAFCPCGRSNKDGKFSPIKGNVRYGNCFSCNQFFSPVSSANEDWKISNEWKNKLETQEIFEPTFIEKMIVESTLKNYDSNNFVRFLYAYFNDEKIVLELLSKFKIGTAKNNKTIFWQIDENDNTRSGKVILYDAVTGKRAEKMTWVHSILNIEKFNLEQCFFGLNQLQSEPIEKTIAITESEKTAILMTGIYPKFIWIASGGATGLQIKKFRPLVNRNIILYPDLGKYDNWKIEIEKIKSTFKIDIKISDILQKHIQSLSENTAKQQLKEGLDIADYAIEKHWYKERIEIEDDNQPHKAIIRKMTIQNPVIGSLIEEFELMPISYELI